MAFFKFLHNLQNLTRDFWSLVTSVKYGLDYMMVAQECTLKLLKDLSPTSLAQDCNSLAFTLYIDVGLGVAQTKSCHKHMVQNHFDWLKLGWYWGQWGKQTKSHDFWSPTVSFTSQIARGEKAQIKIRIAQQP